MTSGNIYTTIESAIENTGMYTGLTKGVSMEPLIHQERDTMIITRPKTRLKKYDIALYKSKDGSKYILHRVVEVGPDYYIIVGDNEMYRDKVGDEQIIGKLSAFYRKGKHFIDTDKTKSYRFYSRIWVALYPLRPVYRLFFRGINKIKRILSGKN